MRPVCDKQGYDFVSGTFTLTVDTAVNTGGTCPSERLCAAA
jgi:hypothetical protein